MCRNSLINSGTNFESEAAASARLFFTLCRRKCMKYVSFEMHKGSKLVKYSWRQIILQKETRR